MPVTWLATLGTKAWWSLSDVEIPRNEDYRCALRPGSPLGWLRFLPVHYGLLVPFLGAAGLLAWRRHSWPLLGLWATWLALHLPMVGFLVADRYRVGTWPLVALVAPAGAALLWQERRRLGLPLSLILLGLAVLPWVGLPEITAMDPARCAYSDGHMAFMEGQPHRARASYLEVLDLEPRDPGAHQWLAQLDAQDKDYASALAHMEVVLEQFPDHFPSLKSAASWAGRTGDEGKEIALLKRAYAVPGDRTSTGRRLVGALRDAGRDREAQALIAADPALGSR